MIELDADELRRQFKAGIRCGLSTAKEQTGQPPETSEEEFQKALTMVFMVVERDCQASANHVIYSEGYGRGLKVARGKL